jgi:hypothetical protein
MKSKVEANKIERLTAKPSRKAPGATPPAKKEAPKTLPAKTGKDAGWAGLSAFVLQHAATGKTPEEINHLAHLRWPLVKETPGWLKGVVHIIEAGERKAKKAAERAAAKSLKSKPEGEQTTKPAKSKKS